MLPKKIKIFPLNKVIMNSQANIVTVIQARMSSSRLPGKVMLPIFGEPLLIWMIERVLKSKLAGTVVVATSTNQEDNVIENLCKQYGTFCFRGHLTDLLDRHYEAGLMYNADVVLKIPSDCPLIDPEIIDQTITEFFESKADYASNLHPGTWPDGNDVEIMKMSALQRAWLEADSLEEREHTTPYIYNNPHLFKCVNTVWKSGLSLADTYRFTIDYKEDYELIKCVYEHLYPINSSFSVQDIIDFLDNNPSIKELNKKYIGEYWWNKNKMAELV
jgi:spore coat polysaccharide biosynthesis protein SpsF